MYVVPVMDLKSGQVVRAVAGQRTEYRPVESCLVPNADPETVGRAFLEKLGLSQLYVADLDAIAGAEPAWECYRSLAECGLSLWIDAGIANVARAEQWVAFADANPQVIGILGGLESLPDLPTLEACLDRIGRDRYIFSLDLRDGHPITVVPEWAGQGAEQIAAIVIAMGVQHLLTIDLAHVGMHHGTATESLCRTLHQRHPSVRLTAGGGIRGPEDIARLDEAGCTAALVSSALHDGRLTRNDIEM